VHDPARHLGDEQHVVAPKEDRVDVEEVGATMPLAPSERNWVQVGPSRRGADGSPWRRSTVATLVFDTQTPSFFSSPTMRRYPHGGSPAPGGISAPRSLWQGRDDLVGGAGRSSAS
jgi:hypothetical protein